MFYTHSVIECQVLLKTSYLSVTQILTWVMQFSEEWEKNDINFVS